MNRVRLETQLEEVLENHTFLNLTKTKRQSNGHTKF
jgi:hypothetical protein